MLCIYTTEGRGEGERKFDISSVSQWRVEQIKDGVNSYPYYFLNIYNYVDWILITLHIVAFANTTTASLYLAKLDYLNADEFIDIRLAVEAEQVPALLNALACQRMYCR